MKILALESSALACSAALCEDENLIAQSFQDNGLTHSVTLLPMAAALLEQCGASLEQVDVVAVAAGPGGRRRRGRWPGLLHRGAHRRGRR